jgi:GMP synthase-like glutamine amidotransferase
MSHKTLKVHYFQHVPFEGLGSIESWLKANSAHISSTKFYEDVSMPNVDEIDWLIVMGGPMSVNDDSRFSWLCKEKEFITQAIKKGKMVLGICLGAQLIASALGARVYLNKYKEIGWYPVNKTCDSVQSEFGYLFPSSMEVFHWHGETFDLPENAIRLVESEVCQNQAISIGNRVLGLQFHLETTPESQRALIENCRNEIVPERFIQSEEEMLKDSQCFSRINIIMESILDHLLKLNISA